MTPSSGQWVSRTVQQPRRQPSSQRTLLNIALILINQEQFLFADIHKIWKLSFSVFFFGIFYFFQVWSTINEGLDSVFTLWKLFPRQNHVCRYRCKSVPTIVTLVTHRWHWGQNKWESEVSNVGSVTGHVCFVPPPPTVVAHRVAWTLISLGKGSGFVPCLDLSGESPCTQSTHCAGTQPGRNSVAYWVYTFWTFENNKLKCHIITFFFVLHIATRRLNNLEVGIEWK
jgi:hypothetical protein